MGDNFENYYELLYNLQEFLQRRELHCRVDIELGRYIAATCGSYVTSIVDVKSIGERRYCLVDGGIHQVNYYGSNMAMRTPIIHHLQEQREREEKEQNAEDVVQDECEYMICGSLCTFADILVRGLILQKPQIGDRLIFENIGAYSVTEGSYLLLSHALPAIYLRKKNGEVVQLRKMQESWEINSAEK